MTTFICRTIARTGTPQPPFLVRARGPLEAVAKASFRLSTQDYRTMEVWTGEERVIALKNPGLPKTHALA